MKAGIPFIIGVLTDLGGNSSALTKLKNRRFVRLTGAMADAFHDEVGERAPALERADSLRRTWAGLGYLLHSVSPSAHVKVKVLDVGKKELLRDLQRAPDASQSALFKKINSEEFDTFGGEPFGCLVADYTFTRGPEDVELLQKLCATSRASLTPIVIGLDASFLNLKRWGDLNAEFDSAWVAAASSNAHWLALKRDLVSEWLFAFAGGFRPVAAGRLDCATWLNPAYAIAASAAQAFENSDLWRISGTLLALDEDSLRSQIDAVLEIDCPPVRAEWLAAIGLDPLTIELQSRTGLKRAVSLNGTNSLAALLLIGATIFRLKNHLREHTGLNTDFCTAIGDGLRALADWRDVAPGGDLGFSYTPQPASLIRVTRAM